MLLFSETEKRFSKLSDQEIWDLLRRGDHNALEYLYRTYGKDLYNFGMKLYGKHEWVHDTLHELFVDLWKNPQNLSTVSSVKNYLFRSFRYKLQRQYSKEKRWMYHSQAEKIPYLQVESSIENKIIAEQLSREQQLKLVRSIEKLPARQREVLHLLFDENLSYEEVAQIMKINVRSAYTLAWKGISSLRKLMIDFVLLLLPLSSFLHFYLAD